jgi:hypothetical protein
MDERERFVKALCQELGVDEVQARSALREAIKRVRAASDSASTTSAKSVSIVHDKPVVVVTNRHLRDIAEESWKLLTEASNAQYFTFGTALADLIPGNKKNPNPHPRILSPAALRGHLERLGDYMGAAKAGEVPGRVPKDVLDDMLEYGVPPMPSLVGVMNCPFVDAGGEVIQSSGFHEPTGLLVALGGVGIPVVPNYPTTAQMEQARELLVTEVFGDFPFSTTADKTNAVAAVLNPIVRPLVSGPTPLHLVESPMPGSGKGKIASVVSIIGTGTVPAVMTEAHDEDEWRKRITARLTTAPPVLLIDNVRRRLDSAALSSALTTPTWSDRLMGVSRIVELPVRTTWLATANNPATSDEIARRIVRIRIDAGSEHPWERKGFRHPKLEEWLISNRGELLWACLTLIKGWFAAGKPKSAVVMGSFEDWAGIMGGILENAGFKDFLGNRSAVYQQATAELEAWRALVEAWAQRYGDQKVGVSELFQLAKEHKLLTELRDDKTERGARTSLGIHLAKLRDRRVGRYTIRLVETADESQPALYRLQATEGNAEVRSGMGGMP